MKIGQVSMQIENKKQKLLILLNQSPHPLLFHPADSTCLSDGARIIYFLAIDFTSHLSTIETI